MKATTHTEVYRPFEGRLAERGFRAWPLLAGELRVGVRRKLPLLLLYAPPAASAIVAAFFVHSKFILESGELPMVAGRTGVRIADPKLAALAGSLIEVRAQIVDFFVNTKIFALLATAWYGAGVIAEDRRLGAHLLYFARPLTRLDYLLGKLAITATYGALAFLVPGLFICAVAAFASPEWSFVTEEGDVIARTAAYGSLWVLVLSTVVTAVSSLADRKAFALVAVFAVVLGSEIGAQFLMEATGNRAWGVVGSLECFARIERWIFDLDPARDEWPLGRAIAAVGGALVVSLAVLWRRIRRLEVAA